MFLIRRNPSVHQIEALNASISAVPEDDPIVLLLARKTDAKFFSDTLIAQLISHLARRRGRLVIRDAHDRWEPIPLDRYAEKIDGVAALVNSQLRKDGRLENQKHQPVPAALLKHFEERLLVSGRIERMGPTRTYIALDPRHAVPVELSVSQDSMYKIREIVAQTLKEFGDTSEIRYVWRQYAEEQLFSFMYEVFQNTVEHGRYSKDGNIISGLRYLRLHVYIDTNLEQLKARSGQFSELKRYLDRRAKKPGTKRFIELTVSDVGQGIVSHYLSSHREYSASRETRSKVLQELLAGSSSGKRRISGVGLGLPNAMFALAELKAFVSLRTEEFWLYRDFSEPRLDSKSDWPLRPVALIDDIEPLVGTQFNVLFDFAP